VTDVILNDDRIHIRYDPQKITLETMLETVRKEGFEAETVAPGP
jgi:hypothetical protein